MLQSSAYFHSSFHSPSTLGYIYVYSAWSVSSSSHYFNICNPHLMSFLTQKLSMMAHPCILMLVRWACDYHLINVLCTEPHILSQLWFPLLYILYIYCTGFLTEDYTYIWQWPSWPKRPEFDRLLPAIIISSNAWKVSTWLGCCIMWIGVISLANLDDVNVTELKCFDRIKVLASEISPIHVKFKS